MMDPTRETYDHLDKAYQVFNDELFGGRLSPCLITLRARKHFSYFHPERFAHTDGRRAHEMALNPEMFSYRTIEDCLSWMVHEQVHVDQYDHPKDGKRPKKGYHDADFAERMARVGLIASSTGAPGGHSTGYVMQHYIVQDGPFLRVARKVITPEFKARWMDRTISRIDLEWTAGKPAVVPTDVSADDLPDVLTKAMAAGASPMSHAPAPDSRTPEGLDRQLREMGRTIHPGGEAPPLAKLKDEFILPAPRQARPPRPVDKSKVKFECAACKAAAWGKEALNIVCGKCMTRMKPAEKPDMQPAQPEADGGQLQQPPASAAS